MMNYKEYRQKVLEKENEIKEIGEQYIKDNSPFQIGDMIRVNGKKGVISKVTIVDSLENHFNYSYRPLNKDGNPSRKEIRLYMLELEHTVKI